MYNRYFFSGLLMSLFAISPLSHAENTNELIIVNHFDQALNFVVGKNPDVLPDLPQTFLLTTNDQIQTAVIDLQKSAYIRVEGSDNRSAFWGVNVIDNKVTIHGYISKGIAYSWKNQIVTFCTPEEYKKQKSC